MLVDSGGFIGAATARQLQKELTCVFCRAKWVIAGAAAGTSADGAEGYINLGGVAGMSPVRDTSTCESPLLSCTDRHDLIEQQIITGIGGARCVKVTCHDLLFLIRMSHFSYNYIRVL